MSKKKPYFGDEEEQAVINFNIANTFDERNNIYNKYLKKPFEIMIQSILRRYSTYIGNYSMDELEVYALSHLIDQMVKYKPFIIEQKIEDKWVKLGDEGRFIFINDALNELDNLKKQNKDNKYRLFNSKAYSYCQTIVRNYFKDHSRKNYNDKKINLFYDDYIDEINQNIEYSYEIDDYENDIINDLINKTINKIKELINVTDMKKNEAIVGYAIINIFKNWENLFMEEGPCGKYNKKITNKFQKNKILFFLKEQTGLSTKEIRQAIKPYKDIYLFEKRKIHDE